VINVERVSKKYCRSLKQSLLYGMQDMVSEMLNLNGRMERLRKNEFWAVDDMSFEIKRGECLGIVGPNGAGKSTLLKLLSGVLPPDKGKLRIRGRMGALIELGAGFHPMLSGRENIYINGAILGLSKKEIEKQFDEIVAFAELQDCIDTPVKFYSSGMYVRLGFAMAAHLDPDIFLIDEILAVGDVAFRMKCFQHFMDLKNAGRTIVLVSHNMIDVNRLCDRVIVMENGKKTHDGDVSIGTATYESHLLKASGPINERAASSPAWIERLELVDLQGNARTEFETGDDLVANVTLSAVRLVPRARLIVHVMTPSLGTLGAFSSPHKGFTFDIVPPRLTLRFFIRAMPLLVGSYSLRLNLYGPEIKDFFHAVTHAASFKIVGPPVDTFGYGVCHTVCFQHDWELIECSGIDRCINDHGSPR
jgi:lipopolysaccharide transport system ATP-binding protein